MTTPTEDAEMEQHGVRFALHDQEIPSEGSLHSADTITSHERKRSDLNPEAEQELEQLKTALQNNIQSSRMQHHAFEPVSLPGSQPASRVPSGTSTPNRRLLPVGSAEPSPRASPSTSTLNTPPLTPAATRSRDGKASGSASRPTADIVTPQRSISPQKDAKLAGPTAISSHPKQAPTHSAGPAGDSQAPSRDVSLVGTPSSTTPGTPRQSTPSESSNDLSQRAKTHSRTNDSVNSRFRFGDRDPAAGYANSGQANVTLPPAAVAPPMPRSDSSSSLSKASDDKRSSFFGGKKHHDDSSSISDKTEGSKSNLKRFFKFGDHHKHHKEKDKHASSHEAAKDGAKTPPAPAAQPSVPFADDHGLASKYGKFGKMLGSGAGGSVRLMKRTGDGTVFAVKQFRDRHPYESEREYNKKVTAEFCIGSTLHHGNVIETIDIIHEKGRWYEVMEYAPFDLFATVMTGKMGREEVTCSTLQILSGVLYLHSMGLAHRDLKLDNVVINDQGIMKLIDFGSAVVFRYPFEKDVVMATGVVGSDPYLAPEVYDHARYDPRPADIWSIAIIFCCMTLRRFPWKAPRLSDNSYRLFVSTPDPDQEKLLDSHRRSSSGQPNKAAEENGKRGAQSEPASRNPTGPNGVTDGAPDAKSEPVSRQTTQSDASSQVTIKGPLRLLRLLPRETRHIVSRMLELDPRRRATMDEILQNPWVQNSLVCRQEENGVIIKAPNHVHTLQPSNSGK